MPIKLGNRREVVYVCLINLFLFLLPGKSKISKTKETAEWTCSVCKIDVHLYAHIISHQNFNEYIC